MFCVRLCVFCVCFTCVLNRAYALCPRFARATGAKDFPGTLLPVASLLFLSTQPHPPSRARATPPGAHYDPSSNAQGGRGLRRTKLCFPLTLSLLQNRRTTTSDFVGFVVFVGIPIWYTLFLSILHNFPFKSLALQIWFIVLIYSHQGGGFDMPVQGRKFCGILYVESDTYNVDDVLGHIKSYFDQWAYCLHDRDVIEESGEIKKAHFHWVGSVKNPVSLSTISRQRRKVHIVQTIGIMTPETGYNTFVIFSGIVTV